jgi:hypothetical protein
MSLRTYHGEVVPADIANAILSAFNQGNLRCQTIGQGDRVMVQIATREAGHSGGKAAMSVTIQKVEDGVTVGVGQLEWLGVAASLGQTALAALINPWNLLHRLDDIAQDINSLTLEEKVWDAIERYAQTTKATKLISERLSTLRCPYCDTANKVSVSNCVGCGAPLGAGQPIACPKCGNVMPPKSAFCNNCGTALSS